MCDVRKAFPFKTWANTIPTLKTLQNYIFVMSTSDIDDDASDTRPFVRWVPDALRRATHVGTTRWQGRGDMGAATPLPTASHFTPLCPALPPIAEV
jgi:hypothetical protein